MVRWKLDGSCDNTAAEITAKTAALRLDRLIYSLHLLRQLRKGGAGQGLGRVAEGGGGAVVYFDQTS